MNPRILLALAVLPLAGCATPDDVAPAGVADTNLTAPANLTVPGPFHLESTWWISGAAGMEMAQLEIAIPVNATGMAAAIAIHSGARFGSIDSPTFWAYVEAQLLDPAGEVLAEGSHDQFLARDIELAAADLAAGPHKLVLRAGGGSDGSANGDYVDYVIDVV